MSELAFVDTQAARVAAEGGSGPSAKLLGLLTFTAGVTVANLYYNQPVLLAFADTFHATPEQVSVIPTATQLGYAAGLLLLVPLGDLYERRGLIVGTTAALVASLIAVGFAPSLFWLTVASFVLGFVTIVPQLVVPYSANLAPPERRGHTVGIVMSGLLVGILLSRFLGGLIGAQFGWRALYLGAAVSMAALAVLLQVMLPKQEPPEPLAYGQLLRSLTGLVRNEPILRRHALVGAFGFGCFSLFWTTIAFQLASLPQHYGMRTVGMFGLAGAAGALLAPLSGRFADKFPARVVNGGALVFTGASFGILGFGGGSLVAMAVGVVLLDAGVQASHVANQTRIFALDPKSRNRLNALYMVTYFLGGAAGSAIGAAAWHRAGWIGVCWAGVGFAVCALLALFLMGEGEHPTQ